MSDARRRRTMRSRPLEPSRPRAIVVGPRPPVKASWWAGCTLQTLVGQAAGLAGLPTDTVETAGPGVCGEPLPPLVEARSAVFGRVPDLAVVWTTTCRTLLAPGSRSPIDHERFWPLWVQLLLQ